MASIFNHNEQDVVTGCLFTFAGIGGLVLSSTYSMGSATEMGPGYFPTLVFGALLIVGLGVLGMAMTTPSERLERWAWRPLAIVLAALAGFGLFVDRLGFILSAALLTIASSFAAGRLTVAQIIGLAIVLTVFSTLIFVVGLHLPIPLWPGRAL